jgi:tRNA(Ile2) C34 agmatinyltransferase TiaS
LGTLEGSLTGAISHQTDVTAITDSVFDRQYPDYVVERETNMTTDMTNYKTSELAQSVDVDDYAVMVQEIADRKAHVSVIKATPQILGGKVQTKIGRM